MSIIELPSYRVFVYNWTDDHFTGSVVRRADGETIATLAPYNYNAFEEELATKGKYAAEAFIFQLLAKN